MSERDSVTPPGDGGLPPGGNDKPTAPETKPAQRNRWGSVRVRLASLVMACVVPVWIAAGFLVYYNYQSRRALTEQRMLETARALTMVVDRELASIQASLSVLASTPSLVNGDLPAFYRRAQVVLETHPDCHIILVRRDHAAARQHDSPLWRAAAKAQHPGFSSPSLCDRQAGYHQRLQERRGRAPSDLAWMFQCSAMAESYTTCP